MRVGRCQHGGYLAQRSFTPGGRGRCQSSARAGTRSLQGRLVRAGLKAAQRRTGPTVTTITYLDAIREAQARALKEDPRVFIYGQDVGAFGGAFKATKNLARQFPGRVMDAPISEDAMVGLAIGAALEGMRPIIEMQFADFSTTGFNQIVNNAAALYWRTNVPCPI